MPIVSKYQNSVENTKGPGSKPGSSSPKGLDETISKEKLDNLNQDYINPSDQFKSVIAKEYEKNPGYNKDYTTPVNFNPSETNLSRLKTYGSKTFGSIGFNPFDVGSTDKKFIDATSGWTDAGRAFTGLSKLAGIGLQDTFLEGAISSKDNYIDFEDINRDYSTTRTGFAGGAANTFLSFGYTLGIIGGIAAEETLLYAMVVASRGLGAQAAAARTATNIERASTKLSKAWKVSANKNKYFKVFDNLTDVNKARTFMGTLGRGSLHAVNPLGNTIDFVRNMDKLADVNGFARVALGVGSVVRDARKFTMAYGEGKLEANMARKEFSDKQVADWNLENPDEEMSEQMVEDFRKKSDNVYSSTIKQNFGLIYLTNGLAFDNMFTSGKTLNKFFRLEEAAKGKAARVSITRQSWANTHIKPLSTKAYWGNFGVSAVSEGSQEVGQDMISNANQKYFARNEQEQQLRGGYYAGVIDDFGNAFENLFYETEENQGNPQGISTFLSGALMGVFAGPVGTFQQTLQSNLNVESLKKNWQSISNNKLYQKEQKDFYAKLDAKAEMLTTLLQNDNAFLKEISKPLFRQKGIQEEIIKAVQTGDKKKLEDLKEEAFGMQISTMFESGLEDEFIDYLTQMGTNSSAKELNQAFNRIDITEATKAEFQKTLLTKAKTIKELKEDYNALEDSMINPILPSMMNPGNKNASDNAIRYHAYENLKKEMLFSKTKIKLLGNRIESLHSSLSKELPITSLEFESIIDEKKLDESISLLKLEVSGNKLLELSAESKKKLARSQEKLEAFEKYKVVFDKTVSLKEQEEFPKELNSELENAFSNLLTELGKDTGLTLEESKANNKDLYTTFSDFLNVKKDLREFQNLALTYAIPEKTASYFESYIRMQKDLIANKKNHIYEALLSFEKKAEAHKIFKELLKRGMYFSTQELDLLVQKGVMPKNIYDKDTNEPVSKERMLEAQRVIQSRYKLKNGILIEEDAQEYRRNGYRTKNDKRTVTDLIKRFRIKLGQVIDLSSTKGDALINAIAESDFLNNIDKQLLEAVADTKAKVKFVTDAALPITLDEDGVYTIDLRYAAKGYSGVSVSFESLFIRAILQHKITSKIATSPELSAKINEYLELVKEHFLKTNPELSSGVLTTLNDPAEFLTEAMNNPELQQLLNKVEDPTSATKKSLWTNLLISIKNALRDTKLTNKTLLTDALNLAAYSLDRPGANNLDEIGTGKKVESGKAEVSENARKSKELEKEVKALEKLAKKMAKRFGTNVSIITSSDVSEKVLNSITNPLEQRFIEILHQAKFGYEIGEKVLELRKTIQDPAFSTLLRDVYEKSKNVTELLKNLKELAEYQSAGKLDDMIDFISKNADSLGDGIDLIQNIFFQIDDHSTGGFYDADTNTAYINADSINENTMLHEIFSHPFIEEAMRSNPEMIMSLFDEASNTAMKGANETAAKYVTRVYGIDSTTEGPQFKGINKEFVHEVIARSIDLMTSAIKRDNASDSKITKYDTALTNFFRELFRAITFNKFNKKINIAELDSDLPVWKLVDMIVNQNKSFDLGSGVSGAVNVISDFLETSDSSTPTESLFSDMDEVEVSNSIRGYETDIARKEIEISAIRLRLKGADAIGFRELTNLNNELRKAIVDLNTSMELLANLRLMSPLTDMSSVTLATSETERVEELVETIFSEEDYDYNYEFGDVLEYNYKIPFDSYPVELQELLATVYRKSLSSLKASDKRTIKRNSIMNIGGYVSAYSIFNRSQVSDRVSLSEEASRANNKQSIEANRASMQERIDAERNTKSKERKSQLSNIDYLQVLFDRAGVTLEYTEVSDDFINDLMEGFSRSDASVMVADFYEAISDEKNRILFEATKKAQALIDETETIKLITENLALLQKVNITDDLRSYLEREYPEIFKLTNAEFLLKIMDIRDLIKQKTEDLKGLKFTDKSDLLKLKNELTTLRLLTPSIATAINKKLKGAKISLKIEISPSGRSRILKTDNKVKVSTPKKKATPKKVTVSKVDKILFDDTEEARKIAEQKKLDTAAIEEVEMNPLAKVPSQEGIQTQLDFEDDVEVEIDLFEAGLQERDSKIENVAEDEFYRLESNLEIIELIEANNPFKVITLIKHRINNSTDGRSVSFAAGYYNLVSSLLFNENQRKLIFDLIAQKFGAGFYLSENTFENVLLKDNKVYQVVSFNKATGEVVLNENGNSKSIKLQEFLSTFVKSVKSGEAVKVKSFEDKVTVKESQPIVSSFADIFSNFDKISDAGVDALTTEELEKEIISVLTNQCKA